MNKMIIFGQWIRNFVLRLFSYLFRDKFRIYFANFLRVQKHCFFQSIIKFWNTDCVKTREARNFEKCLKGAKTYTKRQQT